MKRLVIVILLVSLLPIQAQNKTTYVGIGLIKYFEGFRSSSYLCPAGVWTIGHGHTEGVRPGMSITEQRAQDLLKTDLIEFELYITRTIRRLLKWYEFDALSSFSFNLGYRLKGDLKAGIETGNTNLVIIKMRTYSKAKVNGVYITLSGLLNRRIVEGSLYDGSFSNKVIKSLMTVK